MAEWLKRGATTEAKANSDRKVRDIVEGILEDIEARGDDAVRGRARGVAGGEAATPSGVGCPLLHGFLHFVSILCSCQRGGAPSPARDAAVR